MYKKTVEVSSRKCPAECNLCVEACSAVSEANCEIRRISVPELEMETVHVCNQCSRPLCSEICPSGAITQDENHRVTLDPDRCIGCGLCTMACPYGGVHINAESKKAVKYDGGAMGAENCPYGVLNEADADHLQTQLKEDIMAHGTTYCPGCMMEFLVRFTLKVLGKDIVLAGSPACCVVGGRVNVAHYGCLMTNGSPSLTGITRYYRKIGKDVNCVGIFGDGATTDIAFGALSAAAERNERFLYICYDNEAYMNTGIQRSGSTPQFCWTTTTQVGPKSKGKKQEPKYVPLIMAFHNTSYVATASLSDLEDYAEKLRKGLEASKHGLAFIHVLTPCPTGWRSNPAEVFDVSRAAVETNYAPLWEARNGSFRITHPVDKPQPIGDFIRLMGRFSHLKEGEIALVQETVDRRMERIKKLAQAFPLND